MTTDQYTIDKRGSRNWVILDERGEPLTDGEGNPQRYKSKAEAEAELEASQRDEANGVPFTVDEIAQMTPNERIAAATPEKEALMAWRQGGQQGPRPDTPVLDWMNVTPREQRRTSKPAAETTPVRSEEQEAQLKEIITTARAEGLSWMKVAEKLNEANVPTPRGGPWWDTTASDYAKRAGL